MKKFNKATGRCGYLAMHKQLEYHKDAVPYKILSLNKELYDKNFCILKSIVKAIIFCGKQNVRLRGHQDAHLQKLIKEISWLFCTSWLKLILY